MCNWPTVAAIAVLAVAVVLLVWLSPSLRIVAGPVEIVHMQPALSSSCGAAGELLADRAPLP